MIKWLLFGMLSLSLGLHAQTKRIFVQIDTLDYEKGMDVFSEFKVRAGNQGSLNLGESFESTQHLSLKSFPNFTNTYVLESDSSTIEIPIDLRDSYISIANPNQIKGDTIHINRLKLYKTQGRDTTYTIIAHYKIHNDSTAKEPCKVKRKITYKKEISPPKTIALVINNVPYQVALSKTKAGGLVVHGHGYKPRNYYDKEGKYKKRAIKISVNSETVGYGWMGKIELRRD